MVRASAIEIRSGPVFRVGLVEAGTSAPATEAVAVCEGSDAFPTIRSGDGSGAPSGAGRAVIKNGRDIRGLPEVHLHALGYPQHCAIKIGMWVASFPDALLLTGQRFERFSQLF